jgi:hypothetical protein
MATVRELLGGAHRLLGLVNSGNVLPEAVYQDNLVAMNQMIESWDTERLSVFCTQDQTYMWPPGARIQTLGPTGDFLYLLGTQSEVPIITQGDDYLALEDGNPPVAQRPILLDDSTFFRDPSTNVAYGIKFINQLQYNNIAVKTVTSTYPQVMFVNNTFPNITLSVYPVPSRLLEFHFISVQRLANPTTLETNLEFPPGYLRAFRYNLALELAPEFGVAPPPDVRRIAMYSKRDLKRINNPHDVMAMPYSLMARRNRYNIYAGNY